MTHLDSGTQPGAEGKPRWATGNVVGVVAIILALGGTALAAGAGSDGDAQTAAKKKAKRGPAGPPGPRGPTGPAGPSTGAAGGDLAGSYPSPQIAANAVGGAEIQNGTVGTADLAAREPITLATLGNCVTGTPWSAGPAFATKPGYWKDRSGVVHLRGAVGCTGDATEGGTIFTLPPAYRAEYVSGDGDVLRWGVLGGGVEMVQIALLLSGAVVYDGPDGTAVDDFISLDGISFRSSE